MAQLSIYILEDEMITQEILESSILKMGHLVCGMQNNARKALSEIEQLRPDLVFLDINVKGEESGIWVGNQLNIPFVYLTAYNDPHTIRAAVKTEPISYLIKPFEQMEIFTAIEMVLNERNIDKSLIGGKTESRREVLVKDGRESIKLRLEDILYIKAEGKYIEIYLDTKRLVVRHSLTKFLEELDVAFIARVHKSFAVNLKKVSSFNATNILIYDSQIPISRNFKKQFSLAIERYILN